MPLAAEGYANSKPIEVLDYNNEDTELLMPIKKKTVPKLKTKNNDTQKRVTRSSRKMEKKLKIGRPRKHSTKKNRSKKNSISQRKRTIEKMTQHRMALRKDFIGMNQKIALSPKLQPKLRLKRLNIDKYLQLSNGSYKLPMSANYIGNFVRPFTIKVEECSDRGSSSENLACSNTLQSTEKRQHIKRFHRERLIQPFKVCLKRFKFDSIANQLMPDNSLSNPNELLHRPFEEIAEPPIQVKLERIDEEVPNEMLSYHNISDVLNESNSSSSTSSNLLIRSVRSLNQNCLSDGAISSDIDTSFNDILSIDSGFVTEDNSTILHIAMQRASINTMLLYCGFSTAQFNFLNNLDELQIFLDYLLVR